MNKNLRYFIIIAGILLVIGISLLNSFNNPAMLKAAESLTRNNLQGPFTDSLDTYFAKQQATTD